MPPADPTTVPPAWHRRAGRTARFVATLVAAATVAVATWGGVVTPAAAADPVPPDPTTVTADALPTWQLNGVVWSQATVGNVVYVTGSFSRARPPGVAAGGAGEIDAPNIFAYDITTGNPVPFAHGLNAQGMVVKANPAGTRLYVGGDFTAVDGKVRQHVAVFDIATGALVDDFAPRVDGQVRAFGFNGTTVYVGGNFRAANSQGRRLLAAFEATNGTLLPWSPTVDDGYVWAMVMSPDNSRVIVGGSFTTLNGVSAYGSGAVDASTGATLRWDANLRLRAAGDNGAITSLSTDGTQVYGSGYSFGAGAAFEGTFAANPATGEINWTNDCLGDTYDTFPIGQVLYNVSHRHNCANIGYFPDTNPRSRWIKASADRTYPVGTITTKDAYGWDFTGLKYSGMLHWYPDLEFGIYTSSKQAAWSVTGTSDFVALGGEFPSVNGTPQAGLVRFAKRPIGPKARGPINNAAFSPAPYSSESGAVHLSFSTVWDRDDEALTYDIYRQASGSTATTRIATTTSVSDFWNLPTLDFLDTGQTPGASQRYQVRAKDADGNFLWSAWSSYVAVSSAAPSAYGTAVRAAGASHLWRLGETTGTVAYDTIGGLHGTHTGTTLGTAGALPTETDTAITDTAASKITTNVAAPSDPVVTVQAWVKTTSTRGGRIVGFGNSAAGTATANNTDRVIYLDNTGRANFAVHDGTSYRTIYGRTAINDGQWHQVTAQIGPDGTQLFVDGLRVARDQNQTLAKAYNGFWRVGTDQMVGFTNKPTDAGLVGSIDEVAVYPKALTKTEIQSLYRTSGRTGAWTAAPTDSYGAKIAADAPDLFWRLSESSGKALDSAGNGATGNVAGTVTRSQTGAIASNKAVKFNGSSAMIVAQQPWSSPKAYSTELWFKTTTTRGGKLVGFGNTTSGLSGTSNFDRHVYMYNNGKLSFGVNTGTQKSLLTAGSYNDGKWHHVVATQGPNGMKLWVDTALVGSNAVTTAQAQLGYWRVGGDRTWGSTTSNYIAATIDEVAIYPRALSEQDVRDHYTVSGRLAKNRPPVAKFTSSVQHLKTRFDGTGSSDPDGPVTYAWNFGDGKTSTAAAPEHTFAKAGSYKVSLTVTDGPGAANTLSQTVTVVANQAPTAAFTTDVDGLKLAVDAAAAVDRDGSIDSYAWNYGDGTTGAGRTDDHTYRSTGTFTVTLTVTDSGGATAVSSRAVSVVEPPNVLPETVFTSEVDDLTVSFNGTGSKDPDGTIATYAWNFGDGASSDQRTKTHTYQTAGTYTVTLTITDNRGGTGSISHDVTVRANQGPHAAFSSTTDDLATRVSGADSTDADGTIAAYVWEYGDATSGTGADDTHSYSKPGTYPITLTVTDDDGASDSVTHEVTVAAPTVFGRDGFDRTVASGWGTADKGGSWSIPSGASRHAVDDAVGKVTMSANQSSTATLSNVSTTNAETTVAVTIDKASTGSGQYVSVIGRQVSAGNDYRAKARVASDGTVALWLIKTVDGTESVLGSVTVPGLTYNAGEKLSFRVQVSGTDSTTFKAKVWNSTVVEPASWTLSTTDSTSVLQAAGTAGLYSYLTSSQTSGTVTYSYDAFMVGVSN